MADTEVTEPVVATPAATESVTADAAVSLVFDPMLKKKKKKKKVIEEVDEVTDGVQSVSVEDTEGGASLNGGGEEVGADGAAGTTTTEEGLTDLAVDFGKKKKKKKKTVVFGGEEDLMAKREEDEAEKGQEVIAASGLPWEGSDRDYTYQELMQRAFQFLHGKNAGGTVGGRVKFKSRPPAIKKEGRKKTIILNFADICKGYRRQPEHLLAYLSAELGTTGSLQSNGSLVIKGNFDEAGTENVLRRYIKEYVACGSCHSPDTVLIRDASTRLYFLQCETCGASRSVAGIRQGYMAQIGKRKH